MPTKDNPKSTVKRRPGQRGPAKFTRDMKEAIYCAFHELGGKEYLVDVGTKDPKVFLGLMSKVIPAELQVSGTVLIDIGQAMIEADNRKKQLEATRPPLIDVTPIPKALKDKDNST